MSNNKYLVGVDEGTTSCKVCIFDTKGNLVASASREYPSYYPKPGYVEQDIHQILDSVYACCREAIANSGISADDIVGVSHSNQGITMVLLDKEGNVVRDKTIGWQDVRHAEILPKLREKISDDEYYKIGGMCLGTYNIPVLNWLQENEPDIWKKVAHCCSHQDWFLKQYGADDYYVDDGCANFLSMAEMYTCEWDDRLVSVYNIDKSYLPKIIHTPGTVVGHVSEECSRRSGLPVGCVVATGGLDTNCSALGAGAKEGGTEVLIVGTAGVSILVADEAKVDPTKRITVRTNPGFGNWQQYIMTNSAASAFRWFRDEMSSLEVATGKLTGVDPYDLMTRIAKNSVPGANGVTALTCLQGSHGRRKNEEAKGTLFGITLGTTRADVVQAFLEGITFEMRDLISMNEALTPIKKIRLCGGAAKSPYWCQMFADIVKKPIELTEVPELGALGAAMCAGIGAGLYKDCSDAIDKCVHIGKTYLPNPDKFEQYDEAFERWNEAYDMVNGSFYN